MNFRLLMALWIMSTVVIGVWEVLAAGPAAAEQGSREVRRNAVVVSVTTQADDAGVQVRTLVVSIPEKHDELTFTIREQQGTLRRSRHAPEG